MPSVRASKTDMIREYLNGSLAEEKMPEAEGLIERDPVICTALEHDKLETFIGRLQEALAMPPFPAEQDDQDFDSLHRALAEQIQQSPKGDDTAALNAGDPLASTDSQAPAVAQGPGFAFLSQPQAADEIGRLNGYRVLRLLGQGGMGVVFEAEDVRLKRRVALKVMKPEIAAKEEHRVRFLREAQTAAAVEHDHICPIYQVGEENGVPFIAMPFLKGEPLDARLKRQKPLPVAEAIRIGREVAQGLAQAHKAGLVHRDIKPGNIWLESLSDGHSRCRILDFGLARSMSDDVHLTQSGAIMGTPAYMAPEQAHARPVDHRADLFSLGVILYEMTTGHRPFNGGDTMSILTSLAIDDPVAPNLINPAVPVDLSTLIMQLLAKSPEKRPASGQAVAEALLGALMNTSRPIVEVMPGSAAPRRATAEDRTAVDPWQGIDDSVPSAAPQPKQRTENKAAATQPKRETAPKRAQASKPQAPSDRRRSRLGWGILAASLFLLIGGGFAAYKLYFETKDGTLVVEVDSDADVRFKNGQLQIFDAEGKLKYTLTPSEKNKMLPPGKYLVKIVGADGVRLEVPEFVMEKNGKASLRVVAIGLDAPHRIPVVDNKLPAKPNTDSALRFLGDDVVTIPTCKLDERGPITIEAYFRCDSIAPGKAFNPIVVGIPACFTIYFEHDGQDLRASCQLTDQETYRVLLKPWAAGQRYHLAAVRTKDKLQFYVDGRLVGSKPLPDLGLAVPPEPFRIGGRINGEIREVRVSKVARYTGTFKPEQRFKPDADTLALYHFDEGQGDVLHDSSGNNHHGKIVGAKWVKAEEAPPPASVPSAFTRNALRFGSNDRVEITSFQDHDGPLTVEAFATILEKSATKYAFVIGVGPSASGRFSLGATVLKATANSHWHLGIAGDKADPAAIFGNAVLGLRTHVAFVRTDKELRLFVEGKFIGAEALSAKPARGRIMLGSGSFIGILDGVRVSRTARYDKDFTPARRFEPDPDTLALYHFDEGQGDVLKDSSGNGYDGKIVGAKWVKVDAPAPLPPAISPYDAIDPANLALDPALPWRPKELIAVVGAQRFDSWRRPVRDVHLSKEGKTLYASSQDGTITIRDADSGRVRQLFEHLVWRDYLSAQFAVSPDERWLVYQKTDEDMIVWDLKENREVKILPAAQRLAFSPDGKSLLALAFPILRVIDPAADWKVKKEIAVGKQVGNFLSFALSRDSKRAALTITDAGTGSRVRAFDIDSGDTVCDWRIEPRVRFGSFGLKSDELFFGSFFDGVSTVGRLDLKTGKVDPQKVLSGVMGLALSPDGKQLLVSRIADFLAVRPNDLSQIWSKSLSQVFGVSGISISRDGQRVALGDAFGSLALHDASTGNPIGIPPPQHVLYYRTFALPDGRVLLSGTDIDGRLLDFATGKEVSIPKIKGIDSAIPTPDGRQLIMALAKEKRVAVVDWQAGGVRNLMVGLEVVNAAPMDAGRKLLLQTKDSLAIADFQTGVLEKQIPAPGQIRLMYDTGLAVDPAGRRAALIRKDGKDGRHGRLNLFDLQSGKLEQSFPLANPVLLAHSAFSRDGQWLALGHSDRTAGSGPVPAGLRLWAAATGAERKLAMPKGVRPGFAVDISPDGTELANGGYDGSIHFWDIHTGNFRRSIRVGPANGVIWNVAYAPDGRHLVVNTPSGMVLLLRLATPPAAGAFPPLDPAWLKAVAAMKPEQQVEAVKAELMKRNADFNGKFESHKIDRGVVRELHFLTDKVTDISPVRALTGLRSLKVCGSGPVPNKNGKLADLSPLHGMQLTYLDCGLSKVSDLTPLRGMKLDVLLCNFSDVSDLAPLIDMDLLFLGCGHTRVNDLSPLKDMKRMEGLHCHVTSITSLAPLANCKLKDVLCYSTKVTDLSPLGNMPLAKLNAHNLPVSDLSALRKTPLKELWIDFKPFRDAELLRSIKALEKINYKDAKVFWQEVDAERATFDAWCKQVAAMKAEKQVEAVKVELVKRNPGFDGNAQEKIEAGVVTELEFLTDNVTDISPVRALVGLRSLRCHSPRKKGQLADLSPLTDMKLTILGCGGNTVSDLAPLKNLPLKGLYCNDTQVADLAPLKDMKLTGLWCFGTKVRDYAPLRHTPLKALNCDFVPARDAAMLRSVKTLETINGKPAAEVLKEATGK